MKDNIKYAIEGILFAAGEPVKAAKLAAVLDVTIDEINDAVKELKEEYDRDRRGFAIIEILEGYQICSRPEYYTYIQEILGEQRNQPLSNAAMEALAIIAYKQPITRGQIEKIRGVNSDGCVNRLYERGLIDEAGRLDAPGKPILYVTTPTFLRCFGLKSPDELPPINFVQMKIDEPPQGEQIELNAAENESEDGSAVSGAEE
ncbi:MAG TPA: SMC-Scp complex subunit ScpB [Candidatus Ornithomonoglobus intestinigallinarum]|uniref:Segregation and condensation protein B n=1 Tax=Candidatus Ornithomonoglobus intestinigallinarum TaxID=2840894 RepID=A0A9D1KQJ5_9FIRM|nr:SMC-Scp complex subunit ScpB [Candidatus Ornithomonoglobus intestinigallinarum]